MDFTQKGAEGAKRREYRLKLLAERLTGRIANNFVTMAMEEGKEREGEAISLYEQSTENLVAPVGFVLHPDYDFAGASPDGLVGKTGLLEVKSPQPHTLLLWLETREANEKLKEADPSEYDKQNLSEISFIPEEYRFQMQWQMRCCDPAENESHPRREWCDFWAWYPGLPPIIQRVPRDEAMIARLEYAVLEMHSQIEGAIERMGKPATEWHDEPPAAPEPEYDDSKDFADQDWSFLNNDLSRVP